MHMPERWGYVQFSSAPAAPGADTFVGDRNETLKWALRRLYYRQRTFRDANGRYATTLDALRASDIRVDGLDFRPCCRRRRRFTRSRRKDSTGRSCTSTQDGRVWLTR